MSNNEQLGQLLQTHSPWTAQWRHILINAAATAAAATGAAAAAAAMGKATSGGKEELPEKLHLTMKSEECEYEYEK